MRLVELRQGSGQSDAVSGGNMDRVIERRRIDKRVLIACAAGALVLLLLIFWLFAPRAGTQAVARDRRAHRAAPRHPR